MSETTFHPTGGVKRELGKILRGAANVAIEPEVARGRPQFPPYQKLSPEERRILEASRPQGFFGPSGPALYEQLAARSPRALANYLNQTAVLAQAGLLRHVQAVEGFENDRIRVLADPGLYREVEARRGAYVGPEDSRREHGDYDVSFRENRSYVSQQLSFSSRDGMRRVDIDLDEECPTCGDPKAALEHVTRVYKHKLGSQTDPLIMYERLARERGIRPRYKLS